MKRFLLLPLLLLCISCQYTYGQKIRFTDTSNTWGIKEANAVTLSVSYGYMHSMGLVTKNGIVYTDIPLFGLCREDTALNKVFVTTLRDSVEYVLFDYNLVVGDTMPYNFFYIYTGSFKDTGVVTKISSIIIDGIAYKTWTFQDVSTGNYNTEIIDGIGLLKWRQFERGISIFCFQQDGNVINIPGYSDANSCKLSIPNTNNQEGKFTLSPNPANQYTKITFPHTITSGSLIITDVFGKVVAEKNIQNQQTISIGSLPVSGIYFYRVADKQNGNIFTGRFVYQ